MIRRLLWAVLLAILAVVGVTRLQLRSIPREPPRELPDWATAGGRWIETGGEEARWKEAPLGGLVRSPASPPLVSGQLDRVLRSLSTALAETPNDTAVLSNLASALITRAELMDRPVDLIEALEYLQQALETAPRQAEALYNRALVLNRLALRTPAREAWEDYLQAEPRSPWSAVARVQLDELRQPTLHQLWEDGGSEDLLRAAQSARLVDSIELITSYPSFARAWIEEQILPGWAEAAASTGSPAEAETLETLRMLGRALVQAIHDHTVAETVARIDGASPESRRSLVEGLQLYGRGMASYRAFGSEVETSELLEGAERALKHARSPLWRWARFYRAVGWHKARPQLAGEQLLALAAVTSADRQPALLARIEWLLGTNEVTQNRYERSLEHYQRARELLSASEGPQAAAFADLLIAEALSKLGELDAAWSAQITAIQGLSPVGDRQRLHAALYSAVEQLLLERRATTAQAFVEELVENAEQWGASPGLAEAAFQEGRFRSALGRTEDARESFRRAWDAAAGVDQQSQRQRIEATIALYEAESLLDERPRASELALERARVQMIDLGYRFQLPRLDAARAALSLARSDRETAVAALRSSIAEEESIRREVRDPAIRASAFEGAQRAFDLLIGLEIDSPGGELRAFRWAERSRARVLFDLLSDDPKASSRFDRPVDLELVVAHIPANTDLIEFAVLPERLVVWLVRREGGRRFETKIAAGGLERSIEQFRRAVEYGTDEATVRQSAGELWSLLLGPVAGELQAGRNLVIVPDRFLGRVPFSALFDPDRGGYLVEAHPITVAPSATAYLAAREQRARMGDGPPTSILAVGANHPEHVRLPNVGFEATAVGHLYPRANLLTGEAATRARFLEAINWAQVVHFAGHGKDDAVALTRSRLFFWPEGPGDPGTLFSEELAAIHLDNTRMAVLAACRSVTPGLRGRENVSGLAAAFLAAGVPTVVASLWEVDDGATSMAMTAFHRHLRGGSTPDEALRRAQLELARSTTSYRSPRYWASFVAVGSN